MADEDIHFGPLGEGVAHLCVDMHRMFEEDTEWHLPWMKRVLPAIVALTEPHPERTVFTRFMPVREPGVGHGTWRRYYERYASMTIGRLGEEMVALSPVLQKFVPPATVHDKWIYRPGSGAISTRPSAGGVEWLDDWRTSATTGQIRQTLACFRSDLATFSSSSRYRQIGKTWSSTT